MLTAQRKAQLGLFSALGVLALCVTALIHGSHATPLPVVNVGVAAPDFALDDAQGATISLSALRGKTVVLFFSSTDCPISSAYNTRVSHLAREYATNPAVQFLAVNISATPCDPMQVQRDPKVANRFYPTLCDEKSRVADLYSITQTPQFMVIDPAGIVRYRGAFDDNEDENRVSHHPLADAIRQVVGAETATLAQR